MSLYIEPVRPRAGFAFELRALLLREVPVGETPLDTPEGVATYLREQVQTAPWYDPDKEALVVLMLNTRRRLVGHALVSLGTLDTVLIHPREVFRPAIAMAAAAVVLTHNHPGGDPCPSDADIRTTRDLKRAGELLKIDVLDHVIMGRASAERVKDYASMRELGYFYS